MSIVLTTLPYGSFRRRQAKRALKACSFDFDRLGVDIKVYENPDQEHMGQFFGTYIELNDLKKWTFQQMLLEELGHAVDRYCLTDAMRAEITAAYGGEFWRKTDPDPVTGRNRAYAYQMSETFAHQGFMLAYAPSFYKSNGWPYPTTTAIAERIREIVG